MKVLAILSVLAASALTQELCCLPEEFEIDEGIISSNDRGGKYESVIERRRRAYDFRHRRTGFSANVDYRHGTHVELRILEKYEEGAFWVIEGQQCTKHALRSREPHRCLVNETLVRSYYVGDKELHIDEWGEKIEREEEKGFELRSFVRGTCIPFSSVFVGEEERDNIRVRFTRTAAYEDFTKGISNPLKFFELPSFCPK